MPLVKGWVISWDAICRELGFTDPSDDRIDKAYAILLKHIYDFERDEIIVSAQRPSPSGIRCAGERVGAIIPREQLSFTKSLEELLNLKVPLPSYMKTLQQYLEGPEVLEHVHGAV